MIMKKAPITRQTFLRLCMVAGGSVVAASCQKALQDIATATRVIGTSTASPFPISAVKISLGGNQDVWTWSKQINVRISEGECERVLLRVNGQEFEARSQGEFFAADVRLSSGENEVNAVCLQPGGAEVQSEPVIFTERLRQVPTAVIQISLEAGQIVLNGGESIPPAVNGAAIVEYGWAAGEDNPAPLQSQAGELNSEISGQSISIIPPAVDGEYYIRLRVKDQAGKEDTSTAY